MGASFHSFVVFAEMRTGSNFLETNINSITGLRCHGEAFNPHFIGYPNRTELLGLSQAERDADPERLLGAIRDEPGVIGGFRYFHDHDPRILDAIMADPHCAKIVLTRNPLDSYVSWKIAQATGQWKLTNVKRRKAAKARFDGPEFVDHVDALQRFQITLLNRLQNSGQTAFYLAYEDLQDTGVMNGLAAWLGTPGRLERLDQSLKPQNPGPITAKVSNPAAIEGAISALDRFNLSRTPNFEPRRGPAVPSYVLAARAPLCFLPLRGGPEAEITSWMAELDGVTPDSLQSGGTQKTMRQWMRAHPEHRRFTVLRHPLARAHAVFCQRILATGPGSFAKIRETLRRQHNLPIPAGAPGPDYTAEDHRAAFVAFLEFLRQNLAGQTAIRIDSAWGTQSEALAGFAAFTPPDLVLRESELGRELPALASRLGRQNIPTPPVAADDQPYALAQIHEPGLDKLCASAYQRDYVTFGFTEWTPDQGRNAIGVQS